MTGAQSTQRPRYPHIKTNRLGLGQGCLMGSHWHISPYGRNSWNSKSWGGSGYFWFESFPQISNHRINWSHQLKTSLVAKRHKGNCKYFGDGVVKRSHKQKLSKCIDQDCSEYIEINENSNRLSAQNIGQESNVTSLLSSPLVAESCVRHSTLTERRQ